MSISDTHLSRACQRLEDSRQRLLAHMRGEVDPAGAGPSEGNVGTNGTNSTNGAGRLTLVAALRRRVEAHPAGAMLLDAAQLWWARHPLRVPLLRAGRRLDRGIAPLLRDHPVLTLALAAAVGGALAAARPWQDERVLRAWRPVRGALGGWLRAQFPVQTLVQTLVRAAVAALATGR
ncbi:MAG: hypothetical protein RL654_276 [Pseudomonadota bacterium]